MASKKIFAATGALLLAAACHSSVEPIPTLSTPDATVGVCPAGPSSLTAPLSTLPSGACGAENSSACYYQLTPCPSVTNGTVNSYSCNCVSGQWDCEIVDQAGFCSPLPADDGAVEDSGLIIPDLDSGIDASDATLSD